jgi:hypothetical protein
MKYRYIFLIFVLFFIASLNMNSSAEPRRLVIEFCTGTWCGWCPCGHTAIDQILVTYPNSVVIAYHGGSDPWVNFNGNAIRTMLGFSAYPTGVFDRTNHPGNNGNPYPYVTYTMWSSYAQTRMTNSPTTIIDLSEVSSSYNPVTREVSLTVSATALQTITDQYKIVYVLTEDNVVYPQNFYAQCGTAGYHNDYVHEFIARSVLNSPSGEDVNSGTWNSNQIINKTITSTLDAEWVPGNCNINVIVYKENATGLFLSEVGQGMKKSMSELVGVFPIGGEVPQTYSLEQNYPNPFNPVTNIKFSVPRDGDVTLKIYNSAGMLISTQAEGFFKAGYYNADFNASNLASGVYFYTLSAADFVDTKKMVLVK